MMGTHVAGPWTFQADSLVATRKYRLSNSLEPVYAQENAATAAPHMTCKLIETGKGPSQALPEVRSDKWDMLVLLC
jgi:hypothetical protein